MSKYYTYDKYGRLVKMPKLKETGKMTRMDKVTLSLLAQQYRTKGKTEKLVEKQATSGNK